MKLHSVKIWQKITDPNYCFVIAEAGLNHNGSLALAKKLVDVAVVAGADIVKFQKRTVAKLATKDVLDAPDDRFPKFGKTYREIREHVELGWDEYAQLKTYCDERGIDFLCAAFDIEAVEFLERLGVAAYKLPSHVLTNIPLVEYIAELGKPTILSTGMCESDDIDRAVAVFRQHGTLLALMHCVSVYPTPIEQSNLAMIRTFTERYNVPVGYSGHELGVLPTLASVAMGAAVVERHITLDKTMVGFDHRLSLEPDEFIRMVKDIRALSSALGSGEKYISEQEAAKAQQYHVSMVSAVLVRKGTVVTTDMIAYKNPGTGIPPKHADRIIGKRARVNIPPDVLLREDMVEAHRDRGRVKVRRAKVRAKA